MDRGAGVTAPSSFQWQVYDGGESRWSDAHAVEGSCPRCCCQGVEQCPDCGGRLHHEPVEGLTQDGWEVVHSHYCQQEQEDEAGFKPEMREVAP